MEINMYDKTRVVFITNPCLYQMIVTAKRDWQ